MIRYYSVTEVARLRGVSKQRVSQMIREGKLVPDCYVGSAPGFLEATVKDDDQ